MLAYEGNGNSEGYGNMANPWFGGFCFVLLFDGQQGLCSDMDLGLEPCHNPLLAVWPVDK